jgi:Heterokaryon incompatibility protein (HET)
MRQAGERQRNLGDGSAGLDMAATILPDSALLESTGPIFKPLPNNDWFRLLYIKPNSNFSAPLDVYMHTVPRATMKGEYEALSYSWHELEQTRSDGSFLQGSDNILCNGTQIEVQPNLAQALRYLRRHASLRVLWVDAICINQADLAERSGQVQIMQSIYSQAARSLIWLGAVPSPSDGSRALELLCQIVNDWDADQGAYYVAKELGSEKEAVIKPVGRVPDFDDKDRSALVSFFCRAWFERLWVIQEVALSQTSEVIWQNFRIPWRVVGLAAAILRTSHDSVVRSLGLSQIYHAYLIFRLCQHGGLDPVDLSFLNLLRLTEDFQTSEQNDKVFSLLGIRTRDNDPQNKPILRVDYNHTYEETCRSLAVSLVETTPLENRPLDFLVNSGHNPTVDAPSWVPIWGSATTSMLSPWSIANSWNPAMGLQVRRPEVLGSVLAVQALPFTSIVSMGPVMRSNQDFVDTLDWISQSPVLQFSAADDDEGQLYNAACVAIILLARTFCAGRNAYGACDTNRQGMTRGFIKAARGRIVECMQNFLENYYSKVIQEEDSDNFEHAAATASFGRRLFLTCNGHLGIGPAESQLGDSVAMIPGSGMLFVLREKKTPQFLLIGPCYIDSMMNGSFYHRKKSESTPNTPPAPTPKTSLVYGRHLLHKARKELEARRNKKSSKPTKAVSEDTSLSPNSESDKLTVEDEVVNCAYWVRYGLFSRLGNTMDINTEELSLSRKKWETLKLQRIELV